MGKYGAARESEDDNIMRRTRIGFWITKATNTHLEYVIFSDFACQNWLRERASILRDSTLPVLLYSGSDVGSRQMRILK